MMEKEGIFLQDFWERVMTDIHGFIPGARWEPSERGATTEKPAANLNSLTSASTDEIDQVILELQRVRDMLHSESERLSRGIVHYASLNHSMMTAMKIISESLTQWKPMSREQVLADFKARWLGGNPS